MVLCSFAYSIICVMSRPAGLCTPPFQSVTATIFAPSFEMRSAETEPTLPNPCTATVMREMSRPRCLAASRVTIITPRPVASRRPSEPPISIGLPVTTAVEVWPTCML